MKRSLLLQQPKENSREKLKVQKEKISRGKGAAGSPTLVINNFQKPQNISIATQNVKKPPISKLFSQGADRNQNTNFGNQSN